MAAAFLSSFLAFFQRGDGTPLWIVIVATLVVLAAVAIISALQRRKQ